MVEIEKLADICKLLGDKMRLTILCLLKERELCVCEIVEIMKTSQPNVSQHMRKLKDGGLVKEAKRGQWVYYSINVEDKPYLHEFFHVLPSQKDKVDSLSCEQRGCCD
ncbi:winged helix-turn-helix transcriptional regulator [Paenibacillus sp. SYP-B3998]|uniref:Winged helix-turn-helix transcriptional regulator n=1 Tax=Paenibacillus sp. SYP-B3998 TaxID=2678564 RepID=A0A6G3ZZN9_9BACL|nr:metalloregulator ArsR/SmtB family transcription factor [Paenibacillus sp. SYP-B3998]NEW07041.1 winged helix-turn-helix transcriptional regulator [Paenibacillus sp. SYP-B3998]